MILFIRNLICTKQQIQHKKVKAKISKTLTGGFSIELDEIFFCIFTGHLKMQSSDFSKYFESFPHLKKLYQGVHSIDKLPKARQQKLKKLGSN